MSSKPLFEGYIMMSDQGLKEWKTLYAVLRTSGKTLDCYKDPTQAKLKMAVQLTTAMLYTFPMDAVPMFKNAHLFGIMHLTKRQDEGQIWIVNCSTDGDRQKCMDALLKGGATTGGHREYIPVVPDSMCEGKLDKFGGTVKSRKTRYFVLQPHQLAYYKKRTDKTAVGEIKINPGSRVETSDDPSFSFTVTADIGGRAYKMVAGDGIERDRWIEAIRKQIGTREKSATVSAVSAKLSLLNSMATPTIAPASAMSLSAAQSSLKTVSATNVNNPPSKPRSGTLDTWDEDGRDASKTVVEENEPPIFEIIKMVTSDEPYDDLEVDHMCHAIGLVGVEDILGLIDFNLDEIGLKEPLKTKFKKYVTTHLGADTVFIENKTTAPTVVGPTGKKPISAVAATASTSTAASPPLSAVGTKPPIALKDGKDSKDSPPNTVSGDKPAPALSAKHFDDGLGEESSESEGEETPPPPSASSSSVNTDKKSTPSKASTPTAASPSNAAADDPDPDPETSDLPPPPPPPSERKSLNADEDDAPPPPS